MKEKLEATKMGFYTRMLRIPWTEQMRNVEVLRRIGTSKETDTYNQNETTEIVRMDNEEKRLGDFNTHKAH